MSDNPDILFGNVTGSNIANVFLVLGVAILILPIRIQNNIIKKEIPILMLITLGFSVLFLDGFFNQSDSNSLTRSDGIILILFFSVFVFYLFTLLKDSAGKNATGADPRFKLPLSVVLMALGLAGVIFGSNLVVDNLAAFAGAVGISQKIISVTIIAIGTSLPELATTVTAARKGETHMAVGNIVGSNIFNLCIVLGLPVAIFGEASTTAFGIIDISFLVLSVLFLWIFSTTDRNLKRYEAAIFIAMYCGYGAYIFLS